MLRDRCARRSTAVFTEVSSVQTTCRRGRPFLASDFQSQLGAPPGSIADRLSIFVSNGVLSAADNRYRLTEKGRDLFPVLISALQWAQRWYRAPEGPAVVLTHTGCGRRFAAA